MNSVDISLSEILLRYSFLLNHKQNKNFRTFTAKALGHCNLNSLKAAWNLAPLVSQPKASDHIKHHIVEISGYVTDAGRDGQKNKQQSNIVLLSFLICELLSLAIAQFDPANWQIRILGVTGSKSTPSLHS